jgi:hypothetical protein
MVEHVHNRHDCPYDDPQIISNNVWDRHLSAFAQTIPEPTPAQIRAEALEEAAKCADAMPAKTEEPYCRPAVETVDEYGDPDWIPEQRGSIISFTTPQQVAAAIRALITEGGEG